LHIFVMNWDNLTLATSVNTAISTSAVATSPFLKNQSIIQTVSLLKQLIAAMRVNQHSKWCFFDSLFEVKFRPWLQQIVAKLNVNMSDNNVSVQFWYLHSWLKRIVLSQVTLNYNLYQANDPEPHNHWRADQLTLTCV
jgi:hypothetical protein